MVNHSYFYTFNVKYSNCAVKNNVDLEIQVDVFNIISIFQAWIVKYSNGSRKLITLLWQQDQIQALLFATQNKSLLNAIPLKEKCEELKTRKWIRPSWIVSIEAITV